MFELELTVLPLLQDVWAFVFFPSHHQYIV